MSDTVAPEEFLSLAVDIPAACKAIKVGETRLRELMNTGEITSYLEGSRRRILTSSLREYVARQAAKGPQIGEAKGRKPPPPKRKARQ